jgi:hypothetical protein
VLGFQKFNKRWLHVEKASNFRVARDSSITLLTKLGLLFKNEDVRITLADRVDGPGQRLEVGRKLSPFGPRDLAIDLVDDFQSALVYPAR